MPAVPPFFLELGSFGLVAFLVVQWFRRIESRQSGVEEKVEENAEVTAELTLQLARQNPDVSPFETRASERVKRRKDREA